jgi:hypothetical protein
MRPQYRYKIINELGNSLMGFKTRKEAKDALPIMKEDRKWVILRYIPDDIELNNN